MLAIVYQHLTKIGTTETDTPLFTYGILYHIITYSILSNTQHILIDTIVNYYTGYT